MATNLLIQRFQLSQLLLSSAFLVVLTGCGASPPPCVDGVKAPTKGQLALWSGVPDATQMNLGIDGSGSMLGFTGSAKARDAWKSLIQSLKLASATQDLPVNSYRVGGGKMVPFDNPGQATNPCFFSGCGEFRPVTSSLDSLWNAPGLDKEIPLRVLISDLEVNDGDVSNLIKSIIPHTNAGAVIGILALKLPFDGKVFNSGGAVIHQGEATRPVYLLASGPQSQVRPYLQTIKSKVSVAGLNTSSIKLTSLEDWVNRKTLTAKSLSGLPAELVSAGVTLRFGDTNFSPSGSSEYQFAKLTKGVKGLILSNNISAFPLEHSIISIGSLQSIPLPQRDKKVKFVSTLDGVSEGGVVLNGSYLQFRINTQDFSDSKALRAVIPRGQLPEDWWIKWDRTSSPGEMPQDQTDGLLQLMTSLGELMAPSAFQTVVDPPSTPAASFCLLTNS